MLSAAAAASSAPAHAEGEVDKYENWAVIVFTLQLPTVCRIGLRTLVLGIYSDVHASLAVATPLLVLELAYAIRLFRHMRTLQGRLGCCGRRHTLLSDERLRVRLQYLVAKYADHAPHWQFVLWARQLAIIGISTFFQAYDDTPMVLAEAFMTIGVLVTALWLHCRTQPYAWAYQNKMETVLASCSIVAVGVACVVYIHRTQLATVSMTVLEASVLGLLLGPAIVVGVWLVVDGSRARRRQPQQQVEPLLGVGVTGGRDAPLGQQQRSINSD